MAFQRVILVASSTGVPSIYPQEQITWATDEARRLAALGQSINPMGSPCNGHRLHWHAFMPQTSQKEVTVRLRGKFAFQIAGIENRLAGLMQAGFAGINHEIYRTLVKKTIIGFLNFIV